MKGFFQRLVFFVMSVALIFSCESKRPDAESFEYSLSVYSIQADADVEILDGEKIVTTAKTDENGSVNFKSLDAVAKLKIKVCGGTVMLVSSKNPVAWTGCSEAMFTPVEKETNSVVVDFLSTFITNYNSNTSVQEWMDYLDVTTLSAPELQTSLTDSTKRHLWLQGFAVVAKNISVANGVTPESQYSTENLIDLIKEDLSDDNTINGSTSKALGSLNIDSNVLKKIIAEAIPDVSTEFSASDLKDWTDTIENSDAAFLGGSGSESDSENPVITIEQPSEENEVVWGEVTIKAAATDNIQITSLDCRITSPADGPEIEDTVEETGIFSGSFDSTLIADGEVKVKCIASDGTNITEKEFSVTVSNNNAVKLKAFITNELTDWDYVDVYDPDGKKVSTFSFEEGEETAVTLAPGNYTFVFKGGFYKPVFLDDEYVEFDYELAANTAVIAGETTEVIATPLTTIREKLNAQLRETMSAKDADEKSFSLISGHIDNDFPLYIEPVSKTQLTENSKSFIVLAGLERLAVLIGERHDPKLEAGSITIEQVLKAVVDDIEAEKSGVLDGGGSINQFSVDSYLFRYWYAIAVKLFLESDENLTGLGFSDLQTVINSIAMDDSELFPKDEKPEKVTDEPPVISEKQFRRSFESEFQDYSLDNIIYTNGTVFEVKFKALPDESGDQVVDFVEIFGNVETQNVSGINDEGIYTAELIYVDGDGEGTVGIRAVDNAQNTGTATLQAVKDTVDPVIDKFELLRKEEALTGEYTTVPFTVDYEITEANFRNVQLAVKTGTSSADFSYDKVIGISQTGDFQINKSDLPGGGDDGDYSFSVKFTDKAGNETTTEFQKTIDTVSPQIESIVMTPQINENGFIDSRDITVEITAADNIEQILNYWQRRNETSYDKNANDPPNVFNISEPEDAAITYHFKVTDQAGNETPESDAFSFTIDTADPVVNITNSADLEGKTFKSTSGSLVLNYTIEEVNRDYCELRINGSKYKDVINFPTSTLTLTGSELLDPTIGPAEMNTASIYCIDLAGREKETTVSFYIDDDPPVILLDTDQLGDSVIDDDLVSIDAFITDNFGREGNLTVKFNYTDDAINSLGFNNTHFFPSSGLREIDRWGGFGGGATCSPVDDSCRFWIPHLYDSFLQDNLYENLYHNLNNFNLYLEATDKAGNKADTNFSYTVDKEPIIMNSAGYSYEDGKIYLAFSSDRLIYGFRMRVNGSYLSPDCYHTYIDGMSKHFYSCPFNANTGTNYDVIISSMDYYGNVSFDSCAGFDDSDINYCFQGSITANLPNLAVMITNQSNTNVYYEVSSDSNIINCEILKDGSHFEDCSKSTGSFSKNISGWEDGHYTITATARNGIGAETSRSDDFYIDTTVTSFHLEIDNYKDIYYNSAPTLNISASIAGGVDKVNVYLYRHKQHHSRSTYVQCTNTYCYSTPNTKIAELDVNTVCNPLNGTCFTYIPPHTPSPDLFEPGYYDQVFWTIKSKRNGESESGYFPLNEPIRIAKASSDYAQMVSINVNEEEEELEVKFRPSVFSTADTSGSADISFSVLNNPDISESSPYYEICGDNNSNFKKQYRYYDSKLKVSLDRFIWSGSEKAYIAYFKPNLAMYMYNHKIPSYSYPFAYAPCESNADCPASEEYGKLSRGCELLDLGDNYGYVCKPSQIKNYTLEDKNVSAYNICKRYLNNTCVEYFEYCPAPDQMFVYYETEVSEIFYSEHCPFLRDFWYFPENLKIKGVDDFDKSATATLSSGYTSSTECPQYKELDNFD